MVLGGSTVVGFSLSSFKKALKLKGDLLLIFHQKIMAIDYPQSIIGWIMKDFVSFLKDLLEFDEVHPNINRKQICLLFSDVIGGDLVLRLGVIQCFMFLVQGSNLLHVGMGRIRKFIIMKILCQDFSL